MLKLLAFRCSLCVHRTMQPRNLNKLTAAYVMPSQENAQYSYSCLVMCVLRSAVRCCCVVNFSLPSAVYDGEYDAEYDGEYDVVHDAMCGT